MLRLGRKRLKSPQAVLRGLQCYLRLLLRAGVIVGAVTTRAHAAALPVPCGGGACVPHGGPSVWVSSGNVQTPTVTGSTMHINQSSDKAILNWSSFNVGAGASVDFKQPAATSVALNRIFQGDASKILGALHANGQVYLINQNGFLFGQNARINVHGLVASTLDVDDKLFKSSGIAQAINQSSPAAAFQANGSMGDIDVAKGAVIKTDDGGQVMIFAPNITNDGEIDTPKGQAILAASSDKVYLKINSPSDPGLRGFLVEVNHGGTVTNNGKVSVGDGNATLEGLTVNQNGMVSATTSVQLNGSIKLLARDQVNSDDLTAYSQGQLTQITTHTGSVKFGAGSVTQVTPDIADTSTTVDEQKQLPSTVTAMGKTIDLKGGSKIVVPGGQVNLTATENPTQVGSEANKAANASRLIMEAQSLIDVSGTTDTVVPMERNVVEVQLRGNELKDSPLQRNGVLYGKTVRVDVRKGTPLADVSGAIGGIKRSVSERLSAGGTVNAVSEGDVVVAPGARVDFAGGAVTYKGGYLNTTKLYTQNGAIVDIGNADPNQTYTAILGSFQETFSTWGITKTYHNPGIEAGGSYTPGYVQGMDAGTLSIQARGLVLDGKLQGNAMAGTLQRLAPAALGGTPSWNRPYDQLPLGGQLIIGDAAQASQPIPDFRTPSIVFKNDPAPVSQFDNSFVDQPVDLNAGIFSNDGISRAAIYSNGTITAPGDVTLALGPGGALSLTSGTSSAPAGQRQAPEPSLEVDGKIQAPGGTVALTSAETNNISTTSAQAPFQSIVVGGGADIDVAGMWVNDGNALNPGGAMGPAAIDGGSVAITNSYGDVTLSAGSVVDARGGARVLSDGTVKPGKGGDVSIASDSDTYATSLSLEGQVRGEALGKAGTLAVTADGIRLQSGPPSGSETPGLLVLNPGTLLDNGFGAYNLTATQSGLTVAANTTLDLVQKSVVLNTGYQSRRTGSDMAQFSHTATLPLYLRQPVDLALTSVRQGSAIVRDAGLTIEAGAHIQGDPNAKVALTSDRMISIAGTVDAPAGTIDVTLLRGRSDDGFLADKALWLLPSARLNAPGYVELVPNDLGLQEGRVLDGGAISLQAHEGAIVTQAGSVMDVSGRHRDLSVLSDTGTTTRYVQSDVAGAAGEIQLTAADGMYLDGAMNAKAAPVAAAAGGTLSVTLDSGPRNNDSTALPAGAYYAPRGPRTIILGDTPASAPQGASKPGDALFSQSQLDKMRTTLINDVPATARLSSGAIASAGFDSVHLTARPALVTSTQLQPYSAALVDFTGNVNLDVRQSITIDAPLLLAQDAQVQLAAPYIAIGPTDTVLRLSGVSTGGNSTLTAKADFIDLIGDTALQGFGSDTSPALQLQATRDIRLEGLRVAGTRDITGSLTASGDIKMQAGQIYPSTLTHFGISVVNDTQGTIDFEGDSATTAAPLSAGGVLTATAPNVIQGGTLRAPFGTIRLDGSQSLQLKGGSVTSVSGAGLTVPFGQTQFGRDWVIPYHAVAGESAGAQLSVIGNQSGLAYELPLPSKQVSLAAPSVSFSKGAVVDVSGGGDLYASEFVPGPGGSKDILSAANAGDAFAVVPSLGSLYAPVDPVISSQGLRPGNTIYLDGGNGLPAGEYAMLPARYALLPGAFLVTPVPGTSGMTPGQHYDQLSGIPVIPGRQGVAGTSIRGSLWSGYAVENGAQVRLRAQYTESYANGFFGGASGLQLPIDAGDITLAALQSLSLGGQVQGQAAGSGRGSQVDIVAPQLDVVSAPTPNGSGVQILAGDLNNLGADSILLGGTRQATAGGVAVQADARAVHIGGGVDLALPELMLTAISGTDAGGAIVPADITVASGVKLNATGTSDTNEGTLLLDGDTSLLRIAAGDQPALKRSGLPGVPSSQLDIAAGAQLIAGNKDASGKLQGGSLILDSAGDAHSQGDIQLGAGGSLRLGASQITLGDAGAAAGNQGLVLSNGQLGSLDVANMSLVSASGISLYGAAAVSAQNLTLEARSIDGVANDGQTANLTANTLNLVASDVSGTGAGTGTGTLSLEAKRLTLTSADTLASTGGTLSVDGFGQLDIKAGTVMLHGGGELQFGGTTSIAAGLFSGAAASNWTIRTPQALTVTGGGQPAGSNSVTAFGASLALRGSTVQFDSAVIMPSGRLSLSATGAGASDGVVIGPHANIDVSGRVVDFSAASAASPGGEILVSSANGDVRVESGARMDVAGGTNAAGAGGISLEAPNGLAVVNGGLTATHGSGTGGDGRFVLDAGSIGDLGGLAATLAQGGFTGTVAIRSRAGDLALGAADTLRAHDLTLTADAGNIDVAGRVDASGAQAGRVNMNAGGDLTVEHTGAIDAHATGSNAQGGTVKLGTSGGHLTFTRGAAIDVTGTQTENVSIQQGGSTVTRSDTGTVQFRLPRSSLTGSDLAGAADGITGAGSTIVDAVQVYDVAGSTLTATATEASASNAYYQDAATFMANAPAVMTGLGLNNASNIQLRPGIELQAPGPLTLSAPWDLSQWRFGPQSAPGMLTVRAAGDLTVAANVSAGFSQGTDLFGSPFDMLRQDDSWSLQLVSGSDLSSPDPLAVTSGTGNLTIGNDVVVRTGTGSIDLVSAGNLTLSNANSVVYTAGVDGGAGTYDPFFSSIFINGQFAVGGGDLRIAAGGDITAQSSGQLINAWLPRVGGNGEVGNLPTAWAVNFGNFKQGVGALGGGNVVVDAGGDISDLSVAMPTIGTQTGQAQYDENAGMANVISNQVTITGGTRLDVAAGGNIRGGVFYAAQGSGRVQAGGAIQASGQTTLDPVLALGNATMTVTAGGDLGLETVINPTIFPQSNTQTLGGAPPERSYFFTYGTTSAVHLNSLAGDIHFSNNTNLLPTVYDTSSPMWTVYPGTLSATALQGNIDVGSGQFTLFPSTSGQLQLLAAGSVLAADNQTPQINMSDADPSAMPSITSPVSDLSAQSTIVQSLNALSAAQYSHAPVPVHTGDSTPVVIVARDGSIGATASSAGFMTLYLPKSFDLSAGQDVRNAAVIGQNISADDVSSVQAGRDVVFSTVRGGDGRISANNQVEYRIAGPGQFDIVAGRNVDLGTSVGVTSVGNTQNPGLPAAGANVLVMAGISQAPGYDAFVQKYLADSVQYQGELDNFLSQYSDGGSTASPVDRFKALPLDAQRQFILQVFFDELKASGVAAAGGNKDYSRGFAAIDTLFPGTTDGKSTASGGDLSLLLSRIATLAGGDIRLVVPNGLINAGTANTSAVSKDTSQLGIVVQGGGDIQAYMRGDFNVNQSRVFTLDGGDILVWSSVGNIDAGRGAKTAIAAPPPIVTVDPKTGAVSLVFPPAIAGSGIRAAVTTAGRSPGNVYLFAPQGVVNASDAGIASQGNLTIGASHVLGASNISVGGVSVGVPIANTGSIAASLSGMNSISSGVSKTADNSINSMTSNAVSNTPLADAALSYLDVVVIGLGSESVDTGGEGEGRKRGSP